MNRSAVENAVLVKFLPLSGAAEHVSERPGNTRAREIQRSNPRRTDSVHLLPPSMYNHDYIIMYILSWNVFKAISSSCQVIQTYSDSAPRLAREALAAFAWQEHQSLQPPRDMFMFPPNIFIRPQKKNTNYIQLFTLVWDGLEEGMKGNNGWLWEEAWPRTPDTSGFSPNTFAKAKLL